jgi:uncharacterized caspase-like protein
MLTSLRVFLAAMEGATTEIGMGNALDLESVIKQFQFVELGRQVAEFLSQHPHIDVIPLKSANTEAAGGAGSGALPAYRGEWAEQNSQLEGLRGAIDEVAKKQRHEREKVSELREAMGEVRRLMNQTEEDVERAALGLAETMNRTSRIESDVAVCGKRWQTAARKLRRFSERLRVRRRSSRTAGR